MMGPVRAQMDFSLTLRIQNALSVTILVRPVKVMILVSLAHLVKD